MLYIVVIYFLSFFVCMVGTYLCQGSTPHPAFTSSLSSFGVVVTVAVSVAPIKRGVSTVVMGTSDEAKKKKKKKKVVDDVVA